MPQPPRNDGWKHTPKPNPAKPAANPAPNTSRKPWQPGAPKAKTTGKKTSRAAKFALAGIGVGLFTAAVVLWVLYLQPSKYAAVVVVAPDAPDSLAVPENAAGAASGKGVEDWATGEARGKLVAKLDPAADPDGWKKQLSTNAKAVVLYFAAHGGVDGGGAPFLWMPRKKDGTTTAGKLPLKDILQAVAELKGKPALVVFDLAQTPPNWAFGGAYSDFVRAVKEQEPEIEKVPDLAVLLSADEGQVSWVAEERRKSAFGFYFAEVLNGAGGTPGGPLDAADLHARVRERVQNWAVANRGANQEPLLLPAAGGAERATKVSLATLPSAPYPKPSAPPAAPQTPADLLDEWKQAEKLANPKTGLSPDTTDPLRWREYVEWLMRWERLVRLDAVPPDLPAAVRGMRADLTKAAAAEVGGREVALPAGFALSGTADDLKVKFDDLWKPPGMSSHQDEWDKLVAANAARVFALRTAAADFAVEQVLNANVSKEALATADAVLAVVGGGVQPVEAHYLRMLHKHLRADDAQRPPPALLVTAVKLRRAAERAAWGDGKAYPEQAALWTWGDVTDADAARQLGEDELFDTTPKSWDLAAERFAKADGLYKAAAERAALVGTALARRDKIFARLPYYARWVASARGGPDQPERLLALVVQASQAAHDIDELCGLNDLFATLKPAERVDRLKKASDAAKALDALAKEYADAAARLTEQPTEANWHALDAALGVPFRAVETGRDLGLFARTAAVGLASKGEQPAVGHVASLDLDPWAGASLHLRAAAAYLNDAPLAQGVGPNEKPASRWWPQPVKLADAAAEKVRTVPPSEHLAEVLERGLVPGVYAPAARAARLRDPAVATGGTPTPPAAERLGWRYSLLLAQARRITHDGWCGTDPKEGNPAEWHCGRAAALLLAAAEKDLDQLFPARKTLAQERQDRLTSGLKAEQDRKPTQLAVAVDDKRVVVPDERHIRYAFRVRVANQAEPVARQVLADALRAAFPATAADAPRVGFPASEYGLPPQLKTANPDFRGRTLERRLADKPAEGVNTAVVFKRGEGATGDKADALTAAVQYRGRVYEGGTKVTFAGDPNLVVEYVPPTGPAVMALQADPEAVAGAVTILIDLSDSMTEKIGGTGPSRIDEAIKGIKLLLEGVPERTRLTIGAFVGTPGNPFTQDLKVLAGPVEITGTEAQRDDLYKRVKKLAVPVDGSFTPLAGAIREALDPALGKGFWPEVVTGNRTLVVVTDGADTWTRPNKPGYTVGGEKATPFRVAQAGLKAAKGGVNVHMVLFGMDDEKEVKDQFDKLPEVVAKDTDLPDSRFEMIAGVKDGKELAAKILDAVMPRVRYTGPTKARDPMVATLRKSNTYRPTPELEAGVYNLVGVRNLPKVQVEAGERALLRIQLDRDLKPILARPAVAHELAAAKGYPTTAGENVAVSMPEFKPASDKGRWAAEGVVTLEGLSVTDKQSLKAAYPTVVWFDVTRPGAADALAPRVRIRNHLIPAAGGKAELLAPAWQVSLADWQTVDTNRPGRYATPTVAAYWQDGTATAAATLQRTLGDLKQAADAAGLLPFDLAGVSVQDAAVEQRADGHYLTVWVNYGEPGKPVYLRATGWKAGGAGERTGVGYAHRYYDPHARYTAEFGPFTADELTRPITLHLYRVDDLRKRADGEKRSAVLPGKEDAAGARFTLPDDLKLNPGK